MCRSRASLENQSAPMSRPAGCLKHPRRGVETEAPLTFAVSLSPFLSRKVPNSSRALILHAIKSITYGGSTWAGNPTRPHLRHQQISIVSIRSDCSSKPGQFRSTVTILSPSSDFPHPPCKELTLRAASLDGGGRFLGAGNTMPPDRQNGTGRSDCSSLQGNQQPERP